MKSTARPVITVFMTALITAFIATFTFYGEATVDEDPTFGAWAFGKPAPGHLLATHATLLRNNKILVVGGSSFNAYFAWGKEDARLYDIATDMWSEALTSPAPYGSDKDAFCSGHAHDNTGAVIFQGGLLGYFDKNGKGIGNSARYDPAGGFVQITGGAAHWYPTLVAGVNDMFCFPGTDTGGGESIQKLGYGTTSWTSTGAIMRTKFTYPRVALLPNGKLFVASPADDNRKNYVYDPGTNMVTLAGEDVVPESEPGGAHDVSWKGTGVLLPLVPNAHGGYSHVRFALINGVKAYVKDLGQTNPTWKPMGTRPAEIGGRERHFANSTLLPTGQIFVSGGIGSDPAGHHADTAAVLKPEIYDPETDKWLLTTAANVPRNYHGVALLLPDGRVWTASGSQDEGGSYCTDCDGLEKSDEKTEERVEIFSPWYMGRSDRPVVTACPEIMVPDGRQYEISIGGSQGMSVCRIALIRAGSATHSFDADQRLIQLDIVSNTASSVTVKSPYSPEAAPPGDYMLFALRAIAKDGFKRLVPSVACWTRIATPDPKLVGAPIWRYTGTPCSGDNCPGWQRLDNNPKTVAIAAAGTHHEQAFHQLHNDGGIWRFTAPCLGNSCAGWQRLDRNSKTAAIAAAGNQLYQLHNDGWIWRYTGTPCSGDNCPGWKRLDKNTKTVAIAAAGNQLYQLHNDGWIWRYTGTPCSGDNCPGWQRLDNNAKTVGITAGGSQLYQLRNDGAIWRYTGTPCSGESCPGWQRLDRNPKTVAITAASGQLYQLHNDGWIWRYTGTPCSGDECPGWQRLDRNSRTVSLAAMGGDLFQLHNDGRIWRYTGTPCSGESCPGWQQLDNNPRTGMIVASDPPRMGGGDTVYQLHTDPLYQLHSDGKIWRYTGTECDGESCPGWERLDDNTRTAQIVAAGAQVFQRHSDGKIWRYTGTPCSGTSCPGWQQLDNNPNTKTITAAGIQLFQLHNDGKIWRYSGTPCAGASCPGWQPLDRNPKTVAIAATPTGLIQLHNDGKILRYTGRPCTATSCPGWQLLDKNPNTKRILTAGTQLFQLHKDGRIWRFTGAPCAGDSCSGWQQLDNNARTVAITAGATQLYQLHNDGAIWRYTGTPCSGTSCPGWERLDNNPNTREIISTGNHLYQRHSDGRIWRYIGPPCAGEKCPGWRQLDNNPRTTRITVGGFN